MKRTPEAARRSRFGVRIISMAGASEHPPVVLVGQNEQKIGRFHRHLGSGRRDLSQPHHSPIPGRGMPPIGPPDPHSDGCPARRISTQIPPHSRVTFKRTAPFFLCGKKVIRSELTGGKRHRKHHRRPPFSPNSTLLPMPRNSAALAWVRRPGTTYTRNLAADLLQIQPTRKTAQPWLADRRPAAKPATDARYR